nr:hypothetical protein Iba_chr09cCG3420 [Ipomoea batatas]
MPLDACLTLPVLVASFHTPLILIISQFPHFLINYFSTQHASLSPPLPPHHSPPPPRLPASSSHPADRVPGAGAANIARLSSSEERRRRGGRRFQR